VPAVSCLARPENGQMTKNRPVPLMQMYYILEKEWKQN
jgi:hypothetical protein